jgi:hypothetical protein
MDAMHLLCNGAKWPNLQLKTRPNQLLGSHPIVFRAPCLNLLISFVPGLNFHPCLIFLSKVRANCSTYLDLLVWNRFHNTLLFHNLQMDPVS